MGRYEYERSRALECKSARDCTTTRRGAMPYTFTTDCIGSTGDLINAMRDRATDSTLEEMRERCSDVDEVLSRLGYDQDFPIEGDWHVSYHGSFYDGQPCLYFVWSAIEYVFTREK